MITYSFVITSIIMALIPGTGVIYTISTGITQGKRASIISAIGCTLGIVPHLTASIMMSVLFMKMGSLLFTIIKAFGTVYLIYLGVQMLRVKQGIQTDQMQIAQNPWNTIRKAILINLLNPKLTIFFFAFLPQYVRIDDRLYLIKSVILGMTFMLITLVVFCVYGVLADVVKNVFLNSPRRITFVTRCFGAVFILFAVRLALCSI